MPPKRTPRRLLKALSKPGDPFSAFLKANGPKSRCETCRCNAATLREIKRYVDLGRSGARLPGAEKFRKYLKAEFGYVWGSTALKHHMRECLEYSPRG